VRLKITAPDSETIWGRYQAGMNYKFVLNLYSTVTRNERFYAGDQWKGSDAPDLPKPTINFIKRGCQQKISVLLQNDVDVLFTAPNWPTPTVTDDAVEQQNGVNVKLADALKNKQPLPESILMSEADAQKLSGMFEVDWERLNMDYMGHKGLLDACLSGDFILFNYWDDKAKTGQTAKGMLKVETVDNVNYYPGNPNEVDAQKQPYIILARREMVDDVKAEAKENGAKPEDLEQISRDMDYMFQAGDKAHYELMDNADGKVITLLYLWKNRDTGTVCAKKCTKDVVIHDAWDVKVERYPIAIMNWELRKNSCHGRSEVEGLIPNQVSINKIMAIIILYMLSNGAPKVIYSRSAGISKWDNSITKPIAVNGDVNAAVKYMLPASMAADAYSLPQTLMNMTMQMMGSNDVNVGQVSYRNAYAQLLAKLQQEAPARTVRNRYYNLIKDFALNWLDMTLAYFQTSRWVEVVDDKGNHFVTDFDPAKIRDKVWNVHIDVGEAKEWTQDVVLEQLGNALQSGAVDFQTYLELMPNDYFPNKDEIMEKFTQRQQQSAQNQGQNKKPPSESISFKDAPPTAQAQMLQQAGIQVQPQDLQQIQQPAQPQQPQIPQMGGK
jgi:hypothetical protein